MTKVTADTTHRTVHVRDLVVGDVVLAITGDLHEVVEVDTFVWVTDFATRRVTHEDDRMSYKTHFDVPNGTYYTVVN